MLFPAQPARQGIDGDGRPFVALDHRSLAGFAHDVQGKGGEKDPVGTLVLGAGPREFRPAPFHVFPMQRKDLPGTATGQEDEFQDLDDFDRLQIVLP